MIRTLLACLLSLCAVHAWAARPFVTDDARLATARSCQLESWMRIYRDRHEAWAFPACNPTGNLEFTLGGGRAKSEGEQPTYDYVFQVKTLFRSLQTDDWGWGLAVGTVRHPDINAGPNLLGNTYAYLPFSASFNNDRTVLHANLGWLRERVTGIHNMTWGIGAELQVFSRFLAIAETYGDNHNQPFWQVGGRFAIIPNRVQVDATIGQQFSGSASGRWLSFGLRLTPDRFF